MKRHQAYGRTLWLSRWGKQWACIVRGVSFPFMGKTRGEAWKRGSNAAKTLWKADNE